MSVDPEMFPELEASRPAATKKRGPLMEFDARQLRAINHYCGENNLRPALSTYPTVYMTDKATGEEVRSDINVLCEVYDRDRKESAKERARVRRQEQKRGTLGPTDDSLGGPA